MDGRTGARLSKSRWNRAEAAFLSFHRLGLVAAGIGGTLGEHTRWRFASAVDGDGFAVSDLLGNEKLEEGACFASSIAQRVPTHCRELAVLLNGRTWSGGGTTGGSIRNIFSCGTTRGLGDCSWVNSFGIQR